MNRMKNQLDIRKLFADWVEPEDAHYYLACLLGIMGHDESQEAWMRVNSVFYTNNPVGNCLFDMLRQAVAGGMLETNDDEQFRWNKSFDDLIYWENKP